MQINLRAFRTPVRIAGASIIKGINSKKKYNEENKMLKLQSFHDLVQNSKMTDF